MFISLKKNDRHEKAVNPSVWWSVLLIASRRSGIRPDRYLLIRCVYTTTKVIKRQIKDKEHIRNIERIEKAALDMSLRGLVGYLIVRTCIVLRFLSQKASLVGVVSLLGFPAKIFSLQHLLPDASNRVH